MGLGIPADSASRPRSSELASSVSSARRARRAKSNRPRSLSRQRKVPGDGAHVASAVPRACALRGTAQSGGKTTRKGSAQKQVSDRERHSTRPAAPVVSSPFTLSSTTTDPTLPPSSRRGDLPQCQCRHSASLRKILSDLPGTIRARCLRANALLCALLATLDRGDGRTQTGGEVSRGTERAQGHGGSTLRGHWYRRTTRMAILVRSPGAQSTQE